MDNNLLSRAARLLLDQRRRKYWKKIVSVLAVIVVFCTTYALILPAITMEKKLICGQEEHIHTDECYTENTTLVCQVEERPGHTHTDACYTDEQVLLCQQEEKAGHTHTAECYQGEDELICGQEESEGHTHTAECYGTERVLTCGQDACEAHTHTEDCYKTERILTCEKEEHTHTDDCYSAVTSGDPSADVESRSDWERTMKDVELTGNWSQDVVKIAESQLGYTESTRNFITDEKGVAKGYSRYGAWYGDTYGDWCAMFVSFCLHYAQVEGIPLEANCNRWVEALKQEKYDLYREADAYRPLPGDIVFFDFDDNEKDCEHVGLVAELIPATDTTPEKLKTIEGNSSNKVQYVTYDLDSKYIYGYGQLPEDRDDYICGQRAHQHTEKCYDADGELFCGWDEHIHDGGCLPVTETETASDESETESEVPESEQGTKAEYICGLEEHEHTENCYDAEGNLICELEEHKHAEECLKEAGVETEETQETEAADAKTEEETELTELSYSGPDYTVSVSYGAEAGLPEGVELEVSEIPSDSEDYQAYCAQALEALGSEGGSAAEELVFARFFDIRFTLDGQEYEPAAPVSVTITYASVPESDGSGGCKAIHFGEDGTEVLDVETKEQEEGATSFTHTQDSFSVVGDVVTKEINNNSTDVGPNSLPVDYYVCIDDEWVCVGTTKTGWYGDYTVTDWSDYNRDYITVEQVASILENYGFTGSENNPARVIAYQQKSGDTKIYSDTNTVEIDDQKVIPLARNAEHAGYNLYYLPLNSSEFKSIETPEKLDKATNGFYTVKVYDAQGNLLTSDIVQRNDSFSYDASALNVSSWLVAYGNGATGTISGSSITITSITSSVVVSPKRTDVTPGSHSVTFKVMIDGEWKTVGSLPYYYTGSFNDTSRAYITSDMAAQFFGDYGYTASMEPGYHFGYSYNDIYKIFYARNTDYCMDISGNKIENNTAVQLWTTNTSTAQIFRIWDAGDGYSYITPVENSAYHVNVLGGGTTDGTKLGIHTATDAASHWKVVFNGDGTTSFYNRNASESAVIDLPSGNVTTGNQLQIVNNGSNRYWKLVQQYRISNNIVSSKNDDGTYNIGLTPESNGDIVCYYLPSEMGDVYTDVAESSILKNNTCWSVSVRDDTNTVYSDGELSNMVQYVPGGGEATVTVKNAEGILWSCVGKNGVALEVESTQSGGYTNFKIKNITQSVEVVATKANPSFTVQYYANIPRFSTFGDNPLAVIDTSGRILPKNGGSIATKNLYLEGTGKNTDQNAGTATELYKVKTVIELTKLYSEQVYQYEYSPDLVYFNKLKENESYTLKEIWVLKEGKEADSIDKDDWDVYAYQPDTAFTNEAGQAGGAIILINDGAVIRLVSDCSSGDYYNATTFYDYNISSGKNENNAWITGSTGINSKDNYVGNGVKFAFGNQNCGTGMSNEAFDGNTLNKANDKNSNYQKSTFELASNLDSNGNIVYNSQVIVPNLFNEGNALYKQTYAGSSLTFNRVGDTYTLSKATLKNSNGENNTIKELEYFFHPSPAEGRIWDGVNSGYSWQSNIFTNNFWPMDQANDRTDDLWGKYGAPGMFCGSDGSEKEFPVSDDGNAHNWFFGMNFAISFSLTTDYEGPLEYYFFGDDDLWVFLDSQLVCDIGGVHSSIGEYVNLRDYLPVGSSGHHTLSFFYTERGASGSTCYMSFTLPSVSSATTAQDTGSLQVEKKLNLVDNSGVDYSSEEYKFKVDLLTAENGSALSQTFSYSRSDGTYGTIRSGGTITLHQNESIIVSGIPAGTFYRVEELSHDGYRTEVNNNKGYITSGTIVTGEIKPASFVNTPYYELPDTGGSGTRWYYIYGGLFLIAGLAFFAYKMCKKRREAEP